MHRGVYTAGDLQLDEEDAARAWMLALPGHAAMYGQTAAAWYGVPAPEAQCFQIIVPPGTVPRRRAGLEPHEGLHEAEATVHRDLRVTTPERTWLDLSLTLNDVDLVAAGDAMARLGLTSAERLAEAAEAARGRRRVVRARHLARMVRDRVDSPQETWLRMTLIKAGLPEPKVNPDVSDEAGGWIGRPDLAYEDEKVAIQYEGDVHRFDQHRWRSDVLRDEVMREDGWEVVRVTAADRRRPAPMVARVRAAIDRQRRVAFAR